jgi:death-on-curing protein
VEELDFLSFEDVVAIHTEQLRLYGGRDGFIDETVVRSAIAQPQASMFGSYLHEDIAHMAAAYLFHLAASQGFVDGNKRTALIAMVEFLGRNGYLLESANEEVYDVTMRVANHLLDKADVADWVRERLSPLP